MELITRADGVVVTYDGIRYSVRKDGAEIISIPETRIMRGRTISNARHWVERQLRATSKPYARIMRTHGLQP